MRSGWKGPVPEESRRGRQRCGHVVETLIQEIHDDRLRQLAAKQRAEEDYRREVADALSDGPITVLGRQTLEEVRGGSGSPKRLLT
jgi:hypothetical protein